MSKTSIENKERKLKGKAKKAAEPKADKEPKQPKQKKAVESIPNFGKCVTCVHFPSKVNGEAMPCKVLKAYVARKAEHPECYKCKIGG